MTKRATEAIPTGYLLIPRLIDGQLLEFLWSYVNTKLASRQMTIGDKTLPGTPSTYADPTMEGLLEHLRPKIEQVCGMALHPTYSYLRFYKRGDSLERHKDRDSCEVSVSLNLGQVPREPWPLYIEGTNGTLAAALKPGDAVVYRGIDCFHWREPLKGQKQAQVFLHYVDSDGPNAGNRFDGRSGLMQPPVRAHGH